MSVLLPIVAQGEGWVAFNKPAGLAVIPGRGAEPGTSLREVAEVQLGRKLWVVHRLDRDTSGLLLMATDANTHRTLSMAFEEGRIHKRYLALVTGRLSEPVLIDVALTPARKNRMRPVRPGEVGKEAQTRVKPVELFTDATLVEAEPFTGRTHQIRVHLQSRGHPLLVDHQYGQRDPLSSSGLARTPLHAAAVSWKGLAQMADQVLSVELAEDMQRTIEALRGG